MNNKENIEKLGQSISNLESNQNVIYFLVYDTKNNPRASVKHIYDIALTLKNNGFNSKILVEDKTYGGVTGWLGEKYNSLDVVTIKDDKVEIKIEDIIVIPEFYSNTLESLMNIKCVKIMLIQQKDYIFETLPIGSRWSDYGIEKVITTTEGAKKYINTIFPEILVHIIPPMIEDIFSPSEKSAKPFIAIVSRERSIHRRIISEFYLKFPQLRWFTFKDMVQLPYEEFSNGLKECMSAVWIDDESTFGTFPLECMKSGVPVIGKIPNMEPDWLTENGMWTYDVNKVTEILGTYVLAWLEGVELVDDVKQKMRDTLLPYNNDVTMSNIVSIFTSFKNKRIEAIQKALEKLNQEEIV